MTEGDCFLRLWILFGKKIFNFYTQALGKIKGVCLWKKNSSPKFFALADMLIGEELRTGVCFLNRNILITNLKEE